MNGAEVAAALALATGGTVHPLPCDPQRPAFAVVIPPAGCAALVRDHGSLVAVSVGQRSWNVARNGTVPRDLPAEATRWATKHEASTTLADTALALAPVLERELGEPWVLSIGGQAVPTEMWLYPSGDRERAAVGIFSDSVRVEPASVPVPGPGGLAAACLEVAGHAREQLARYARNVSLGESCRQLAAELAQRLGLTSHVSGAPRPTYSAPVTAGVFDGRREVVKVSARGGQVWVDSGLPGDRGWHGTAAQAESDFEAVARAVEAMAGAMTYDTLEPATRYVVLEPFEGLEKGEVVTYGGAIDNHAPHVFLRQSGGEVLVEEWWLRENVDRVLTRP
jgi:hypothetical protein